MDRTIKAQLLTAPHLEFRAADNYEKGGCDCAIADYSKAIELNSDDKHAYRLRGTVYVVKGDDALAKADFAEADRS